MKKTLLLLLTLVCSSQFSNAYTIDEIIANGEWMIAKYTHGDYYDLDFNIFPYRLESEAIHLTKIDDSHLLMSGVAGSLDFEFELLDENRQLTTDGQNLSLRCNTPSANNTSKNGITNWHIICCTWSGNKYNLPTDRSKRVIFRIEKQDDNKLHFVEYGNPETAYTGDPDGVWGFIFAYDNMFTSSYCGVVIDSFDFAPFEGNAIASDVLRQYNDFSTTQSGYGEPLGQIHTNSDDLYLYKVSENARKYPVQVDFDNTKGTFTITNLNNHGYAVNDKITQLSYYERIVGEYYSFTGKFDAAAGTASIDANQKGLIELMYTSVASYWGSYQDWIMFPFVLTEFTDINGSPAVEIKGTYSNSDKLHHNTVEHGWVTNDGQRRTYEGGAVLSFPAMTYQCIGQTFYHTHNWINSYHNTEISCSPDVTVDVKLHLNNFSVKDGKIGVHGEIETVANPQYVDHYEICIVPGLYSSINDEGFEHHVEHGHVDATNLHEVTPENTWYIVPRAGEASRAAAVDSETAALRANDYSFFKYPESLNVTHPNDKYTVFIKTVYKPETGLTPTFHDMQYVQTPTGIDENLIDSANAETEYYTLQGIRVVEPQRGNVYIVRRGNEVSKIRF